LFIKGTIVQASVILPFDGKALARGRQLLMSRFGYDAEVTDDGTPSAWGATRIASRSCVRAHMPET